MPPSTGSQPHFTPSVETAISSAAAVMLHSLPNGGETKSGISLLLHQYAPSASELTRSWLCGVGLALSGPTTRIDRDSCRLGEFPKCLKHPQSRSPRRQPSTTP